jgi:hypothetical protein
VADAAARVADVPGVARDDVEMQVEDRLAGGPEVHADVEAVRPVALEDLRAGNGEGRQEFELLVGGGVPP